MYKGQRDSWEEGSGSGRGGMINVKLDPGMLWVKFNLEDHMAPAASTTDRNSPKSPNITRHNQL